MANGSDEGGDSRVRPGAGSVMAQATASSLAKSVLCSNLDGARICCAGDLEGMRGSVRAQDPRLAG